MPNTPRNPVEEKFGPIWLKSVHEKGDALSHEVNGFVAKFNPSGSVTEQVIAGRHLGIADGYFIYVRPSTSPNERAEQRRSVFAQQRT